MTVFSRVFVLDALERAIKTFAQALLAVLGATTFDWFEAKWGDIFASAGLASAVSVLTSIVSAGVVTRSVSPASAVPCEVVEDDRDSGQGVLTTIVLVLIAICAIVWLAREL